VLTPPFAACSIGAVPPVGFVNEGGAASSVLLLMDQSVCDLGSDCCVLVGGGSRDTVIKMTVAALRRVIINENEASQTSSSCVEPIRDLCRSSSPSCSDDLYTASLDSKRAPLLQFACDLSIARAGIFPFAHVAKCLSLIALLRRQVAASDGGRLHSRGHRLHRCHKDSARIGPCVSQR
jgi:hypothetical protein